jgi:hypothetical protein
MGITNSLHIGIAIPLKKTRGIVIPKGKDKVFQKKTIFLFTQNLKKNKNKNKKTKTKNHVGGCATLRGPRQGPLGVARPPHVQLIIIIIF